MDILKKPAPTELPINNLLKERWSTRAISSETMTDEQLHTIFEAARWAPSSSNVQPWRYVYATKDDGEFRTALESLLDEGNYWAKNAYILAISFAQMKRKNHEGVVVDNYYGLHDTGAANLSLVLQAFDLGLAAHQMGGFDKERAKILLGVPEEYVPASMIAIGYFGDTAHLKEHHLVRETAPRERKPQDSFLFHQTWKQS